MMILLDKDKELIGFLKSVTTTANIEGSYISLRTDDDRVINYFKKHENKGYYDNNILKILNDKTHLSVNFNSLISIEDSYNDWFGNKIDLYNIKVGYKNLQGFSYKSPYDLIYKRYLREFKFDKLFN